ncbi:hypothetical protein [Pseudoalteromonas luteoviolacea]|uniref:Uncharacterized protein n=1 Tax=Pseudoalteromonas luteoviolacea NCIMB 1942 TaxID=1365253 RepID=A0A167B017_9GAMM|nr:hypothetical protein [Pseudoalteromonas luteoviolacea]KZN46002.1 hypothetical protein N482_13060 [Pseudoalteromonas luteoviolacea NCIMB 1942]
MMMINHMVKGGIWDINRAGRSLAVIRAQPGLLFTVFDLKGEKIIDSELPQGTNLSDMPFERMQLVAQREMDVTVWVSNYQYSYTEQPTRPDRIAARKIPLLSGKNLLLDYDPPRQRATVSFPMPAWVGGKDMYIQSGIVYNARQYAANQEIEITNYGEMYYYVQDPRGQYFFQQENVDPTPTTALALVPSYTQVTRSQLDEKNVPYFDILIPPELDNVPIRFDHEIKHRYVIGSDTPHLSTTSRLLYTVGGVESEELAEMYLMSPSGGHDGRNIYRNYGHVSLSAGAHRFYMVERYHGGYPQFGMEAWGPSGSYLLSFKTDQPVFRVEGYADILEERT